MEMADLISRAAAIRTALCWYVNPDGGVFNAIKANIRSNLEQVPAVDAAPVVHARWKALKDGSLECTNCLRICPHDVNCYGVIIHNYKGYYCPWCGAKMDGERRDSE